MAVHRSFGRCMIKGCKTRVVINKPITFQHNGEWINLHAGFFGWIKTGDANERFAKDHGLICQDHKRYLKFSSLKGTYNPGKVCNDKCMGATGPSCDCECGGELHGGGKAIF